MQTLLARDVAFQFSQATAPLFSNVNFSLNTHTHGIVGRNGVGKSIFLQLLAGKRRPTAGSIINTAKTGYLSQHADFGTQTGADTLGLTRLRQRYEAICTGDTDADDFPWDFEDRAKRALAQVQLSETCLSLPSVRLSGGEQTKLRLATLLLANCEVLLLDEPSNHLDAQMRTWLAAFLCGFSGQSVIVTHDTALLEIADTVSELTPKAMLTSVGGWADYQASRAIQLETLDKQVTQHKTHLRQVKKQRQADQERQTRKSQRAKKSRASANQSKSVLDFKAGRADSTKSRLNALHEKRVVNERAALTQAQSELENVSMLAMSPSEPKHVSSPVLHLADVVLPFGQTQPISVTLHSGEKLAAVGDNGAGKSTLLRVIMGEFSEKSGTCQVTDAVMLLDQHLTLLDSNASALDNFQRLSPSEHWREADYRTVLAQLRLRGDKALLPIMALSGGERLKVALACVFLGETAPALLLLDEPDNHLDLASKALLASTLNHFNGSVLLISHDTAFVQACEIATTITLEHL